MKSTESSVRRQSTTAAASRRGVAMIDPISVLFSLAVLATLVLPAVQQSREAARRTQCKNNMKQIGLALFNYHDVYTLYPPALFTSGDTSAIDDYQGATTTAKLRATDAGFALTWAVGITPYIYEQGLYRSIDFHRRLEDQSEFL